MVRCLWLLVVLAVGLAGCGPGNDNPDGSNEVIGRLDPVQLNDGQVGLAYNSPLFYSGILLPAPAPNPSWSVVQGALPPGLTLGTGGSAVPISGTPTAPGSFAFRVRYEQPDTDVTYVASRDYLIVIHPAGELFIETGYLLDAGIGNPYNRVLTAYGGTGVGYTWSVTAGALPPGMALGGNNVTLNWGAFAQTGLVTQTLAPRLTEISGIAASRSQPGVFWVHDDSGNAASVYAIDAAGALLQQYDLSTTNADWEDICLGPGPLAGVDYLYVGDFGDNGSVRGDCHLLRVQEPTVPATPQAPISLGFEAFYFVYPGGAQNCETLLVDWESGTPYTVEKTAGTVRVHKFPMPLSTAWTSGAPTTLIAVSSTITGNSLTGGDASLDARRIVLRNGGAATEYARPQGASFDAIFTQTGAAVTVPGGQQYEAICYSSDGTQVFTTTELAAAANVPLQSSDATPGPNTTTIAGTCSVGGTYTFTVQVMDSAGTTATRLLTLVVR